MRVMGILSPCCVYLLTSLVLLRTWLVLSVNLSSSKKQCVDSSCAVLTTHLILMVDFIWYASGSLPSTLLFHHSNTTALTSHNKLL